MLQHEVPRYFPLQPEQARKDAKNRASTDNAGAGRKATSAGLRGAEKVTAAQPDYSYQRIPQTVKEIEHDKLMASNVFQVEVRETESGVICNAVAEMFCDFGDICVRRAADRLFWVDFEHFEQSVIDKIKMPKTATSTTGKEHPVTNLHKIKYAALKENDKLIKEIRFYWEAKRYPFDKE